MRIARNSGLAAVAALSLSFVTLSPQNVQAEVTTPACRAAPILSEKPSGSWTPTAGVSVNTWNFAQGVSHSGPEATRVSVASTTLSNFDLKVMHDGFPKVSDPYSQLTKNNAFASINTDFFDLSWPAFAWGPVINNSQIEYLPLTYKNDEWQRAWLKVVGTTDQLPDIADGYLTNGLLTTKWRNIILDGVYLDTLSSNSAIAYDNNFVGTTPQGGATVVVSNGLVTQSFPEGSAIQVPANSMVIQAVGNQAIALRKIHAQPEVTLSIPSPDSFGYAAKGSIAIGSKVHPAVGVNLATLKTGATVFTNKWSKATTPRGALTWVIKAGKVFKVFAKGATTKPLANTTVIQFLKPSATAKAVKVGASVKMNLPAPTTQTGYKTTGSVKAAAGTLTVGAINVNVPNFTQVLVFDQDWNLATPRGAVTITLQGNRVIAVDADGNTSKPVTGQYVLQVPQAFATLARTFDTKTTGSVSLDLPTNLVRTLSSTHIRSTGNITVGQDVIPIGAVNHNRFAKDFASVFDNRWLGQNGDKLTIRAPSSVVVRAGLIAEIHPNGSNLYVNATDTVVQFPWMYKTVVAKWTVGMPIQIANSFEALNGKSLITTLGRGTPNVTDGIIVAPCGPSTDGIRPRTSIGWDQKGKVWMITASPTGSNLGNDGYRDGGATVHQMSGWLQQLGATDAVSFDGGGSTWMMRKGTDGPHRVDMADPGPNWNPWIRYVPIALGIVAKPTE